MQDPAPEPTPPPPRRKRGTGVEIVPEAVRKRCAAALAKEHASLQREHEERSARAESKRAVDARYTAVLRRRVEAHPAAPRLKSPLPLEEALEAERRRLSHIRLESASGAQQLSRSHAQYVVGAEQQRLADIRLDSERAHAEAGWRAQGSPYEFQPTQPQPQPQMQMQMQMQMQPQQPPPPPQQQQQKKLRN